MIFLDPNNIGAELSQEARNFGDEVENALSQQINHYMACAREAGLSVEEACSALVLCLQKSAAAVTCTSTLHKHEVFPIEPLVAQQRRVALFVAERLRRSRRAQLVARGVVEFGVCGDEFIEGYGRAKHMGIRADVVAQTEEVLPEEPTP